LQIIFEERVKKEQGQLDKQLETKLPDFFANWYANRDEKTFGNARDVLNLYQKMEQHRASRVRDKTHDSHRFTLTMVDVPERLRPYLESRQPENLDSILKNLDHLVGLETVKKSVQTMVNRIKVQRLRGDKNEVLLIAILDFPHVLLVKLCLKIILLMKC
jgi:hypothetical protein